jgi:starch synthase
MTQQPESLDRIDRNDSARSVLFAVSEALPLIKTGGLADVAGSLPIALAERGVNIRLVMPAYPQAVERSIPLEPVTSLQLPGWTEPVRLLEGRLAGLIPLYLVDAPGLFDRVGNPYVNASGNAWADNALRFGLFNRAVVAMALGQANLGWLPDLVHCNDWQTGLIPALLSTEGNRPATIFTIHNLAYQGIFDRTCFDRLGLPPEFWSPEGLEFHGNLSFIKGGLAFADWISTVSPSYAMEILTPGFGNGLEGLLQHRSDRLQGVLNGIDYQRWDPATDHSISPYDSASFQNKKLNKLQLQQELGLRQDESMLLFGHIGRLVRQKGVDLILEILPDLVSHQKCQVVFLGAGEHDLERALRRVADQYPNQVSAFLGYDEALSHRVEAACDCFLMPSRFEPCGLNQLYSLRYGTIPIVHRTGGLADTVIDATSRNLLNGTATGFVFDRPTADALWGAVERVMEFRQRPGIWWRKLATTGMQQDYSWNLSAGRYLELYQKAVNHPASNPVRVRHR